MMNTNTISICVRSLSTYAEADWVTPAEALEFMDKQNKIDGSEEFIIVDYDAPFSIGEYDDVSDLAEISEKLEELTDDEIEVLATILDGHTSDFEEALKIVEDGEYMVYWDCHNMADVAEHYLDETCMLNDVPDFIRNYIDFEAYGRDMSYEGTFLELVNSCGYVQIF